MKILLLLLSLFLIPEPMASEAPVNSSDDDRIQQLVDHFNAKGVDIKPLLDDERFALVEKITRKFTRSAERRIESLDDYKKVIGYDAKKSAIDTFYSKYSAELKAAEAEYGIPKEVIIGIIAVESDFGKNKGRYNPFNVYVSMYVEDHRAKWALAQLEDLIEFAEKKDMDILSLKSSYAGAMSYAQFIPTSLKRFWVGNELYHMPDNINSVANYLAHFVNVTGSLETAVLRYNPSSLYQSAVLALAEDAESIINSEP
ncbi:MAG: lytic murein transglycosylase [Balneolaceae bacterium]|nr:lytic murein transglycosylase [Balneolaceae bacterium]